MLQEDQEFYHVLYLDEPRVDSILAQINFGLVTGTTETRSNGNSETKEHDVKAGPSFFNWERKHCTGNSDVSSISETINIHHAKILQLASLLNIDLSKPRTKLPQHTHGSIFAYEGITSIMDTENIKTLLNNTANMLEIAMRGNIPDFQPDDDYSSETLHDFIEIIQNMPKGIYFTTILDNNLVLGGTLDPDCFNPLKYNHSFINGLNLPDKWIIIGYCFNKNTSVDDNNPIADMIISSSGMINAIGLLKDPDVIVVPLVIMR